MRKYLLLFICLAMIASRAQALVALRMEGEAALLREDGVEILPVGAYADIVDLGNARFALRSGAHWALADANGELLTEPVYDELHIRQGAVLARRGEGWGLLYMDGTELSSFNYERIVPAGAGCAWAQSLADTRRLRLLHTSGMEQVSDVNIRQIAEAEGDGLIAVQTISRKWGYCDASGRMAIPARYDHAGRFIAGMAVVIQAGRYGAIDATGRTIAEPDYDFVELSPAGFIVVVRGGEGAWVLNGKGTELASYEGEALYAGLVGDGYFMLDDAGLRVYDASGALLTEAEPDASISEGVQGQLILSEGMWGEYGAHILGTEQRYQHLFPLGLANGKPVYACMEADAARYVNDMLGEIQISVDMDTALYGVVDDAGNLRLPVGFEQILYLSDDRFQVLADGVWHMIDIDGKVYWSHALTQSAEPSA